MVKPDENDTTPEKNAVELPDDLDQTEASKEEINEIFGGTIKERIEAALDMVEDDSFSATLASLLDWARSDESELDEAEIRDAAHERGLHPASEEDSPDT